MYQKKSGLFGFKMFYDEKKEEKYPIRIRNSAKFVSICCVCWTHFSKRITIVLNALLSLFVVFGCNFLFILFFVSVHPNKKSTLFLIYDYNVSNSSQMFSGLKSLCFFVASNTNNTDNNKQKCAIKWRKSTV